MTPIMTVPSNLSATAAEHHQQMLAQAQAYAQAQLQTQRPQRPPVVQPRIILQDPPAGHPHKAPANGNGTNGTNGVHDETTTTTAEDDEPVETSVDREAVDQTIDQTIKRS